MAIEETKGTAQKSTLIKVVDFTIDKLIEMKKAASIVGEKIEVDGMTIIPISKVSIGFAGGGSDVSDRNKGKYKNPAGTGAGISDTPQGDKKCSRSGAQSPHTPLRKVPACRLNY